LSPFASRMVRELGDRSIEMQRWSARIINSEWEWGWSGRRCWHGWIWWRGRCLGQSIAPDHSLQFFHTFCLQSVNLISVTGSTTKMPRLQNNLMCWSPLVVVREMQATHIPRPKVQLCQHVSPLVSWTCKFWTKINKFYTKLLDFF
jgi:hypothetical protein